MCAEHSAYPSQQRGAEIVRESIRRHPSPDWSPQAVRDRVDRAARRTVPDALHGWTRAEYVDHAKLLIQGIGGGSGKRPWRMDVLASVRAGRDVPTISRDWAAKAFHQRGQDAEAAEVRA
jgi:hypothetical protein